MFKSNSIAASLLLSLISYKSAMLKMMFFRENWSDFYQLNLSILANCIIKNCIVHEIGKMMMAKGRVTLMWLLMKGARQPLNFPCPLKLETSKAIGRMFSKRFCDLYPNKNFANGIAPKAK